MEKSKARKYGGMLVAAVAVTAFAFGVSQIGSNSIAEAYPGEGEPTYVELQEMYPDEYNSAMTHKTDDEGEDNSHAGFQALMETPAERDVSGAIIREVPIDDPAYTPVALKCVACKSSQFVTLYEQKGVDAFTSEILDEANEAVLDGMYWDCYSCHVTDENGKWVNQASCAYADETVFPEVAAFYDTLDERDVLCGQCHNTVSSRGWVKEANDVKTYDPYRYGYGFDARYQAMIEDGMFSVDEATGMKLVSMNHPQIEMIQDSIHQSMGLSCVDCHMVKTTNEDGETFTSHNASGSVADNDDAMTFCLTCHTNLSGVETIDDMRGFLKDKQDEQVALQFEVEASMSELYDAILEAVQSGDVDEATLEAAKENYQIAYWYVKEQQQNICDAPDGAQIAHNPQLMRTMLEQAGKLCEDGISMLEA